MNLDISIHKGEKDKPVVIFIHGLGMDKNFWIDPLHTKIFAKNIPLKVFTAVKPRVCTSLRAKKISVGEFPEKIENLWTALKKERFNMICWSQKDPVGPISSAVEELTWIMKKTKKLFPEIPVALIGHSRGGLIARKFMEKKNTEVKALITISSPHAGSSIAKLSKYLKPFSALLKGILPKDTHSIISETIKNIVYFLEGSALKELHPGSGFLKNLRDSPQKGVNYISFGGIEPRLFTVYVLKKAGKKMYPKPLLTIPDSISKIFPSFIVADEIAPGKGDGLVTTKSSLLPWASRHYNLRANHISITWNRKTISNTINVLKTI